MADSVLDAASLGAPAGVAGAGVPLGAADGGVAVAAGKAAVGSGCGVELGAVGVGVAVGSDSPQAASNSANASRARLIRTIDSIVFTFRQIVLRSIAQAVELAQWASFPNYPANELLADVADQHRAGRLAAALAAIHAPPPDAFQVGSCP